MVWIPLSTQTYVVGSIEHQKLMFIENNLNFTHKSSSLDKQCICVNRQLKSSKKQFKLNVYVPKSNSAIRYAITCNVIAYYLVHFLSVWVINKCQQGIDFFYQRAQYNSNFGNKKSASSQVFLGKETFQSVCEQLMSKKDEICFRYIKIR